MLKRFAFLSLLLVSGCTTPNRSTLDFSSAPENKVILVGRISIDKKLPNSTHVVDVMDMTQSGLIRAGDSPQAFANGQINGFETNDILVKWNETFSVPYDRFAEIFVSGVYAFSYDKLGQSTYLFPVRGKINTQTNSRFIYIGHISLHLDDFFVLKSIKVIDEFNKDPSLQNRFKGIKKNLLAVQD